MTKKIVFLAIAVLALIGSVACARKEPASTPTPVPVITVLVTPSPTPTPDVTVEITTMPGTSEMPEVTDIIPEVTDSVVPSGTPSGS